MSHESLGLLFCSRCEGRGWLRAYEMDGTPNDVDCPDCQGPSEEPEPLLPYNGTSGWSGSDTSRERAVNRDTTGITARSQAAVMRMVRAAGPAGVTWQELSNVTGWHHGTASGALSVLHKEGLLARLSERRNRCKVYVTPENLAGRDCEPHGRKPKPCSNCGHVEAS